MIKLFQRFSHQAEEILLEAQNIANQNQRPFLSDALVLAFLLREKTFVFEILKQAGLKKDIFNLELAKAVDHPPIESEDELMVILQEAAKKAYQQKSSYIEPEHLFLSLIEKSTFLGTKILLVSGVNVSQVKYQLNEFFSGITELATVDQEILEPKLSSPQNHDLLIDSFSYDLTQLAQEGKLNFISGRDQEISQICQILCRRLKNNPLIIGEPGVGKTALVEGLAQAIVSRNVPKKLVGCRILALDLGQLIAGTNFRGQFEDRITAIIDEVVGLGNIILFIDEVHTTLGAGNIEGSLDVAQILKPALAGGELSVIGATTFEEYRKYIEKDRALARRFSTLTLSEPSKQVTALILKNIKKSFESHYQIKISDSLINLIVDSADRYLPERYFPDKAIDLLDEAAASTLPVYKENPQISLLKDKIKAISRQKIAAVDQNNFQLAKSLKDEEDQLHNKFLTLEKNCQEQPKRLILNKQNIIKTLEQKTNLPINLLRTQSKDAQIQTNPEQIIQKTIFGQKKAIGQISRLLKMIDLERLNRKPLFSAVFIGPSGVGKTETAKIIAEKILGSRDKLIKFDMSEFSERHTVSSLIGAPAGYVGFEEGGRLTNAVKKSPFSVVLFDEIEKAHSDIFNLFLQLLEDGFLTDNLGRKINFNSTIIIFTSNLGNDILNPGSSIGFQKEKAGSIKSYRTLDSFYKRELKEFFSQELLARIDDIIIFDALDEKSVKKIIKRRLVEVEENLCRRRISLIITNREQLLQKIVRDFDAQEGARGIAKFINHQIWSKILNLIDQKPQANIVEIAAGKKIDIKIR